MGDLFHHTAVAAQGVDIIVERVEPWTTEVAGDAAFGTAVPTLLASPWPRAISDRSVSGDCQ
jgi:hypothetical protein